MEPRRDTSVKTRFPPYRRFVRGAAVALAGLVLWCGPSAAAEQPFFEAQPFAVTLTANAMPGDLERGAQAGFHRYLTKPVNIDELLAAIEDALEGVS